MKQIGNLAIVCAQRRSVQFTMENGEVRVTIRNFPEFWQVQEGLNRISYLEEAI